MVLAEQLPEVFAGDNMFSTLADWARRYRALARKDADLIAHVEEHCQ